uniref:Acetyl-coenzyme A carboxylase carboxyl transferase subunit beta n=1 Tax=Prototheca zopfii TaxID=3112 RepID=A0A2P1G7Q3_9CHLO|nr:acetyl CoA reductase [Prototheca bovis]AVM80985.1 acetyl CoA reductase [Prototheca bovis]
MSILRWMNSIWGLWIINAYYTVFSDMWASLFDSYYDYRRYIFYQCEVCGAIIDRREVRTLLGVCPDCGFHSQLTGHERLYYVIDQGTWTPLNEVLSPVDSLKFDDDPSYGVRVGRRQIMYQNQEGAVTGLAFINKKPVAIAIMDFNYLGGSMGSVIGEQITRLIEHATKNDINLIIFCASGGARMQESSLSLMQMGKVSAALNIYQKKLNLLYISVCTSPTTGGVTASFAMLGDFIFAEPGAIIAFAGRRVVSETLNEEFPEGYQTSEYLFRNGQLDAIVDRFHFKSMVNWVYKFFRSARYNKRELLNPYGKFALSVESTGFHAFYQRRKLRERKKYIQALEKSIFCLNFLDLIDFLE